jgi:hypothetical protein
MCEESNVEDSVKIVLQTTVRTMVKLRDEAIIKIKAGAAEVLPELAFC